MAAPHSPPRLLPPRLLPSGDSAVTVEFSRNIDDAANRRVLALDRAMANAPVAGVTETVPTYRSLLVHYNPVLTSFEELGDRILTLAELPVPSAAKTRPISSRESSSPFCSLKGETTW